MKLITAVLVLVGLSGVAPDASLAQGRHDDKPHAQQKPAQTDEATVPKRSGGRHDEGVNPHAPEKKQKQGKMPADGAPEAEGKGK